MGGSSEYPYAIRVRTVSLAVCLKQTQDACSAEEMISRCASEAYNDGKETMKSSPVGFLDCLIHLAVWYQVGTPSAEDILARGNEHFAGIGFRG